MHRIGIPMAAFLVASCGGAEKATDAVEPSFTKAHDMKQLMAVVVQPQADVFWKSAGSVTEASGVRDLRPTTDEGWLRAQSAAATLVEIGNLMQTPLYAAGRGKDWLQFSQALSQISMKAEKAVRERASEDEIFEIGGTMYNVCSACHQAYPPAAGEIPAASADADNAAGSETAR